MPLPAPVRVLERGFPQSCVSHIPNLLWWKIGRCESPGSNQDATSLSFEVSGSRTGPDGSGTNTEIFVSKSGRVKIEPRDWMLAQIMKIFKQTDPPPVGFEVHWSVFPMFEDTYRIADTSDLAKVYETTLFQLAANTHHTVEIIPNGDGVVPIEALQVYRPSLR